MMEENKKYVSQDRGTKQDYGKYLEAMDAVSVEKVASGSAFFDSTAGNTIVDVGMASGTSSHILSLLFPKVSIIGVDINPKMVEIASQKYNSSNLSFRVDDGETLTSFAPNTIDGFFSCSSIHHITSYNNYDANRARNTIRRQVEVLKTGGIAVVRDFVKPPQTEVILEVSCNAELNDTELLVAFAKTARSLSSPNEQGFPIQELQCQRKGFKRFKLFYADAVEFIRRKDYRNDWAVELQEEYGYFTQAEFEELYSSLGLRIIVSAPLYNPWIIKNRYTNKFTIYNKDYQDIGYPPTNYLIAGEKIKQKASRIGTLRHLPESDPSFLKYNSYKNTQNDAIYDVVERPQPVLDILPYYREGNSIFIVAKHGFPRPLSTLTADNPCIDEKHFSGYITESITAAYADEAIETTIAKRTGITSDQIKTIQASLEYLPSAGGINEKVSSLMVELQQQPNTELKPHKKYTDFNDAGTIRTYDAVQLLKTAQTGALAEARLELNIYNVFRRLSIPFPIWLGQTIAVAEQDIDPSKLSDLLQDTQSVFEQTTQSANYLEKFRVKFTEIGSEQGSSVVEYVVPREQSINTLISIPVTKHKGELYIGLEKRNLPVPQLHFNTSTILVAPAVRLPKTISNYKHLNDFIAKHQIQGANVASYCKLGEKFFPSIGLTPEQVYPYVVVLDAPKQSNLLWIKLSDAYENIEKLHDGHLLISIMRLTTMFKQ